MKSYKEKIIVDDDAITLMNLSDIHRNATINKFEATSNNSFFLKRKLP